MKIDLEKKKLLDKFLEIYYFNEWKEHYPENSEIIKTNLELIVSPTCNTKCSYCYYKNFKDELYCSSLDVSSKIVNNAKILLEWFISNNYKVKEISIFSGEFFNLPYYKEILNLCKNYFTAMGIKGIIVIPSNGTFLFSEEKTKEIEGLITEFLKKEISIAISLSIDGKFLDNKTRKIKSGKEYTDKFYNNAFSFARKWGLGFHPMVSAEGIDLWEKNFVWYMDRLLEQYDSIDEAFGSLYLLEVRNPDWKTEDLEYLEKFILFLVEYSFNKYGRNKKVFIRKIIDDLLLNLFSSFVASTGRGISCSAQNDFGVRLGDLAIVPCHRTSYDGYNGGYFKTENNEITGVIPENPESYILYKTFDVINSPGCDTCVINNLCSHYCMGTNMEVNKDFYIPVETVCRMEFIKAKSIAKAFMNIDILEDIIDKYKKDNTVSSITKAKQMMYLRDIINKEANERGIYRSKK